jgi:hypothetical protein
LKRDVGKIKIISSVVQLKVRKRMKGWKKFKEFVRREFNLKR